LDQLLHGLFVPGPYPPRNGDLLRGGEQRGEAHLMEVLVEDVLVRIVDPEGLGRLPLPGTPRPGRRRMSQDFRRGHVVGDGRDRIVRRPFGRTLRSVLPLLGHGCKLTREIVTGAPPRSLTRRWLAG